MINPSDHYDRILKRAIAVYGSESQIQMAFGECGEFVALAGKAAQGRLIAEDWIDEIADVTILMAQMRNIFGPELVDERIFFKMNRLETRLNEVIENHKGAV